MAIGFESLTVRIEESKIQSKVKGKKNAYIQTIGELYKCPDLHPHFARI
jgi:hypothetical protein